MAAVSKGGRRDIGSMVDKQLYFEDIEVGHSFSAGPWKLDQHRFAAFAGITGDAHPIHYDAEYVRNKTDYPAPLAHGLLLTALTALGATSMSSRLEDSLIAFGEIAARFLKPVYLDDSVTSHFAVADKRLLPSARGWIGFDVHLRNEAEEAVLEARQSYLVRCRQPQSTG